MSGFLLDTNVVSELVKPIRDVNVLRWFSATDESILFLSVLTLGEIRKGVDRMSSGRRRAALESWIEIDLRARFQGRILPVDEGIADRWGSLSAAADQAGKPAPTIDAILAATAVHHNLTLVTRNPSDVAGTGVSTVNPWV